MKILGSRKRFLFAPIVMTAALLAGAASRVFGDCGPFTDVNFFCSPVLELYYLGITSGTSPTTYAPDQTTTRGEIAAFIARSFNQSIKRSSRRAALGQWWTTQNAEGMGLTAAGTISQSIPMACDGADVWVAGDGTVSRVRASDGKLLETWTGADGAGDLIAMGRVFVMGRTGRLFMIDPSQTPGAVATVADNLGIQPDGIAFDGAKIWTANSGGSVSIVTPGASLPWTVATVTAGFSSPAGILYDGAHIWVADSAAGTLLKLDSSAAILQTVAVGSFAQNPVFDGANIWVPNSSGVSVVRASTGAVLSTLTGNGLMDPFAAAFDGERVLVLDNTPGAFFVSLWRAADLTPLGSFSTSELFGPAGVCSDGLNFWIAVRGVTDLSGPGHSQLARF